MECTFVAMQLMIVMQNSMINAQSGIICMTRTKILMGNLLVFQIASVMANVNVSMDAVQVGPDMLEILMNPMIHV